MLHCMQSCKWCSWPRDNNESLKINYHNNSSKWTAAAWLFYKHVTMLTQFIISLLLCAAFNSAQNGTCYQEVRHCELYCTLVQWTPPKMPTRELPRWRKKRLGRVNRRCLFCNLKVVFQRNCCWAFKTFLCSFKRRPLLIYTVDYD